MQVEPSLTASLAHCLEEFGGGKGVALYSNSAGLQQYDPQGASFAPLFIGMHMECTINAKSFFNAGPAQQEQIVQMQMLVKSCIAQ